MCACVHVCMCALHFIGHSAERREGARAGAERYRASQTHKLIRTMNMAPSSCYMASCVVGVRGGAWCYVRAIYLEGRGGVRAGELGPRGRLRFLLSRAHVKIRFSDS